jgi:hypothetical protein
MYSGKNKLPISHLFHNIRMRLANTDGGVDMDLSNLSKNQGPGKETSVKRPQGGCRWAVIT